MFYLPRLEYEAGWGSHVVIMQRTKIGIVEICNIIISISLYSQIWMTWQCVENCYLKGCVFKYNSEHFWLWLALIRVQKKTWHACIWKNAGYSAFIIWTSWYVSTVLYVFAMTWTELDRTFWACQYWPCKFYHLHLYFQRFPDSFT